MHELKTWIQYFTEVWNKNKPFEVRKNDRNYEVGDTLKLLEYDHENNIFTGRYIFASISYILHGGAFGVESGFCVLGLQDVSNYEK